MKRLALAVRRWENGDRDIPGPVKIIVKMALHSAAVRRVLGLTKSEG